MKAPLLLLALLIPLFSSAKTLAVKGAVIRMEIQKEKRGVTGRQIEAAVLDAAGALVGYYGRFPVKKLRVNVLGGIHGGQGIFGQAFGGKRIQFYLGKQVSAEKLRNDWILVHEMFHLGFPDLDDDKYNWIGEGLSTYLEGIARVRVKLLTPEKLWRENLDGFADALPRRGDGGLNGETRYRRLYWGGALFWFLMDLEIREKSNGKKSLDDVMLAILAAGGTGAEEWTLAELAAKTDGVAGFPILNRYYERFGPKVATEDLDALWRKLGIIKVGDKINFDEKAPLAGTLNALMTQKRHP